MRHLIPLNEIEVKIDRSVSDDQVEALVKNLLPAIQPNQVLWIEDAADEDNFVRFVNAFGDDPSRPDALWRIEDLSNSKDRHPFDGIQWFLGGRYR